MKTRDRAKVKTLIVQSKRVFLYRRNKTQDLYLIKSINSINWRSRIEISTQSVMAARTQKEKQKRSRASTSQQTAKKKIKIKNESGDEDGDDDQDRSADDEDEELERKIKRSKPRSDVRNDERGDERENLENLVLEIIENHNDNSGINDTELARALLGKVQVEQRMEIINELLAKEKIQFGHDEKNKVVFTKVSEEEIQKRKGLTSEDHLVLQIINTAGNNGMWTKEVKQKSNLAQVRITKIFKTLEQRKLIKSVKHVAQQNRKVYMKYDLEPSREITGGVWFTDHEFDEDFADSIRAACLQYIKRMEKVTLQDVCGFIDERKISRVKLRLEDVKILVDTLIYDGEVDKISPGQKSLDEYEKDFVVSDEEDSEERDSNDYDKEDEEEESADEEENNNSKKRKKGAASSKKTKKKTISSNNNKKQKKSAKGGKKKPIELEVDDEEDGETYYVPSTWNDKQDMPMDYIPCGICMLTAECTPGGLIAPETCVYMKTWLKNIDIEDQFAVKKEEKE